MYFFGASKKLVLATSSASQLDIVVSHTAVGATADVPDSFRARSTAIGNTDITPVVGADPIAVRNISIRNNGLTQNSITIAWTDGVNTAVLHSALLQPGWFFQYGGEGWNLHKPDGSRVENSAADTAAAPVATLTTEFAKGTLPNSAIGSDMSLWKATGYPLIGVTPTAAAVCSVATVGALPLPSRTGGQVRRLRSLAIRGATASQTLYVADRLAHMGGLSGIVATAQTINIDLLTLAGTNNIAARMGAANYSEVQWFLEWYAATGATIVTPVVAVTYDDGSTGNANVWVLGAAALPASVAISRRYQILPAVAGRQIRGLVSVTHPTTGTAGNYGATASRKLASIVSSAVVYRQEERVYLVDAAPVIADEACLELSMNTTSTATGNISGTLLQVVSAN